MLRPLVCFDRDKIYEWRNREDILSLGTLKFPVSREEHDKWYDTLYKSPSKLGWIIGNDEGFIRLERHGDTATLSVYLLTEFRGRGKGVPAIKQACKEAFAKWPVDTIHAYIREDNERSIKAFTRAGFIEVSSGAQCPQSHREMVLYSPQCSALYHRTGVR